MSGPPGSAGSTDNAIYDQPKVMQNMRAVDYW